MKNFRIFLVVVVCFSVLVSPAGARRVSVSAMSKDHIINWGISPTTNETAPDAPPFARSLLDSNNGLYLGNTDKKEVHFTFDLGYEAGYTSAVLDILKEHKIKGIFFLCGNYLQEDELISRMIAEGHTIGNHTDRHKDLPTLSDESMKEDIVNFSEKFYEKYGSVYNKPLSHFRPPKGRISERVLQTAAAQKLKTVMWSIAIVDWGKSPINTKSNADKIAKRIHPGAVVLLHITNSGTPQMLKLLIPQLLEKGYTFADAGTL